MTATRSILFCAAVALGSSTVSTGHSAAADTSGRTQASWWVHHFGAVTRQEEPLVARSEEVFGEVSAAADKRGNRLPRLVVVRAPGDPFAVAIEDGTVVLSHAGLRRCYADVPREIGDARLAFLLGHELAHLAKDDFWHLAAFTAIEEHLSNPSTRERLLDLLRVASDVDADVESGRESARLKELQADAYGLVYMRMAGFDPEAILGGQTDFLELWTAQVTARAAYDDPTHPAPAERAAFLRAQLGAVADELDFFRFGVRLLQLGREEDAILLLERFAERFPSREVHGNLGLAHYRLGLQALHRCDPLLATSFRLSTEVDPTTLAGAPDDLSRAGPRATCVETPAVRDHLRPAIAYLEHATALDPSYVPAHLNLSSAYLLGGEPSRALAVLDRTERDDRGVRNNRAVALYLFGRANSIETMDQASGLLDSVLDEHPRFADALYNLAVMEGDRGRHAAAREHWKAFLRAGPSGPWAARARARLGEPAGKEEVVERAAARRVAAPPSPVPLGAVTAAVAQRLATMERRPFRLGIFHGEFALGSAARVLVLEDFVEVVESELRPALDSAAALRQYGPPERTLVLADGELMVYDGFAVEVRGGRARRVVHFETETR